MKSFYNKNKKHIPNILTTLRLTAVPVFWFLTLTGNLLPATILFGTACITDALDGYLARRFHAQSVYGKITDPLADKMLVMSALLLNGITSNHLMLFPFILESGIVIVNIKEFTENLKFKEIFKKEYINDLVLNKKKCNVSQTGREKTVALMTTVSLSLLNYGLNLPLDKLVNFLILVTSIMELTTLVEYIDAKIINKNNNKMRLPNFAKESEIEENKSNKKELSKTNRKDTIEQLNKEKEFLLNETNKKEKTKKKNLNM